ncbi:MAG TPA: alpha-hydroxyketone-type quorum-sensing autoinducer synthase [Skermanella sp.]|jgi:CAI-1 autoinducer synthase|nr:alpha-hydroxyketone-type quorum-sensing autoinducer synthase [Skermanella sp.]
MAASFSSIAARAAQDPDFFSRRINSGLDHGPKTHRGSVLLVSRAINKASVQVRTNDYLSIANNERIINAEINYLRQSGHGEAISRVFTHKEENQHRAFERRIAKLLQAEDAVTCMSGYCANIGLIQAIAAPETPIYIDMMAHASLWEGVNAARATARPFLHNNPGHLERQLREYGPGIVVVDAVYSTNGALCPLADIVEVSERYGCVLVVDETHSFGAQGPRGAGLTVALGLADRVHFRTVGLSKAVASRGGVVVGSARNMEFFRYEAYPMIFSTSVLGHEVAGFEAALDIIETEEWRRTRLHRNHAVLRAGLDDLGYNVDNCDTQILSLEAGLEADVKRLRDALEENDVFGSVFCAPATPKKRALVRFTVNASLTDEQIQHVLSACARIRTEVGMAGWASTRRRKGYRSMEVAAE